MSLAAERLPSGFDTGVLSVVERLLGWIMEGTAAVLMVAEVIILLMGVISRFVFDAPLVWSDEIASLLFLWLAMLGAAIALRRGVHMRLTTVTAMMAPRWRARLDALALGVPLVFLALLVHPTLDYVDDQSFIDTPALSWPGSIRAAAMLAGIGLMLAMTLLRLARLGWRDTLLMAVTLAVIAVLLWWGWPLLIGIGNWNLLFFFVLMVGAGVLLGVPIAFAFGLSTCAYLLTTTDTPMAVVVGRLDEGMSSLILLAVPLFVLLGQLVEMTGMARVMVAFLAAMIGHVRGGLSYVLLGGMLLVSGISGSKAADMAAVAPVLFPEMKRRGLNEGEMVSLLAASGAMAETIPPSIVLIAIASVTGVSVAALFTGGLLPGLVLAIALGIIARQRTNGAEEVRIARAPVSLMVKTFVIGLPALVLPLLIRTAVVEGVATATEVSTIGIVYAIMVGLLVYRQFPLKRLYPMLVDAATLSGAILFIIGAATGMAWALTQSGFSNALAQAMGSVPGGQWGFLAISIVAFIILGSVLEGIPAMVLFGPLLFPIARQIGVHEVHYAVVIILAMGIGLFAPPFGLGFYTACTIGNVHPDIALRRIWPYLGVLTISLMLLAAVPWFSTGFLP